MLTLMLEYFLFSDSLKKPPNGFQTEPEWFLGLKRKVEEELISHTGQFRP